MKKVLLIGFILAILLLAFPQGVMAVDDATAVVNADLAQVALNFKVTEPTTTWNLVRGANDLGSADPSLADIKIEVDTSNYWTVSAEDTTTAHKGHLISTSGEFLANPLMIETTNADTTGTSLAAKVDVGSGNPGSYTDTIFYRNLHQLVETTDKARSDYTITLTFSVAES